ncbi:MAG TPA: hypothetical protein VLF63_01570 [Patescibacteria group bacterium]|nr:hypothetical protein [Patescibacteria group bacterium]
MTLNIKKQIHDKITELGLDPVDTTDRELYFALREKAKDSDRILLKTLRSLAAQKVSAEGDPIDGLVKSLENLNDPKTCFALKLNCIRALLKKNPPKKTMRMLGYRSLDSMLKRESPVIILAAACLSESSLWHKKYLALYKKVIPSDFEERKIQIIKPNLNKWKHLINQSNEGEIICLSEIGTLVILPVSGKLREGFTLNLTYSSLADLNEIRAISTYLKLNHFKKNFGQKLYNILAIEPLFKISSFTKAQPWQIYHKYYSQFQKVINKDIIDPFLRIEDTLWQSISQSLIIMEPKLKFWENSDHLAEVSNQTKPVSFHLLDNAHNIFNNLDFEDRSTKFVNQGLRDKILLEYANQEADNIDNISEVGLSSTKTKELLPL